MTVQFGIDRLLADPGLRASLKGRRVALLAHPASVTADLTHSLDALSACDDLNEIAPAFSSARSNNPSQARWNGKNKHAASGIGIDSGTSNSEPAGQITCSANPPTAWRVVDDTRLPSMASAPGRRAGEVSALYIWLLRRFSFMRSGFRARAGRWRRGRLPAWEKTDRRSTTSASSRRRTALGSATPRGP